MSTIFGGGDDTAKKAAQEARVNEAKRQAALTAGRTNIDTALSGFDDNFYNDRSKAYGDWALPQLDDQFTKQKQKLIFALSRGGLLNSSAAGQRQAELNQQYGDAKTSLGAKATDYANSARRDVSNTRANLLGILTSTEDPNTVGDEATRQATTLRAQPSFDPLGSLFTDVADQISKVQNAKNLGSAVSSGANLFSSSGNSGRVVN